MGRSVRSIETVLLVEDSDAERAKWARECNGTRKTLLVASDLAEALRLSKRAKPQLAVVDLYLPQRDGLDVIRGLRQLDPDLLIMAVSGYMTVDDAMECVRAGADDCFIKPVACNRLLRCAELGERASPERSKIPTLERVEHEFITRVLNDHGGNSTRASEVAGIGRHTLSRKLQAWRPDGARAERVPRRRFRTTLSPTERHDLNNAQQLMHEAFLEVTPSRRAAIAEQALVMSPHCADAYVVLAETAVDLASATRLTREAVEIATGVIGEERFNSGAGKFWTMRETRPYMRARLALARCIWAAGEHEEAIAHYRELIRVDTSDHLCVRYMLARCLRSIGRDHEVAELIDEHQDDLNASWSRAEAGSAG